MDNNRKPIIIPVCDCISDGYTFINNTPSIMHLNKHTDFNTIYDFIQNSRTVVPIMTEFNRDRVDILRYILSKKIPLIISTSTIVPYQLIDILKDVLHSGLMLDIQNIKGFCDESTASRFKHSKDILRQYMVARANKLFVSANIGTITSKAELVDCIECLEIFKNAVTCVFANINDESIKSTFSIYCSQRKLVPYIFDIDSRVCDSDHCLVDYKPFIYENDGCSYNKTYDIQPYKCDTCGNIELPVIGQLQL